MNLIMLVITLKKLSIILSVQLQLLLGNYYFYIQNLFEGLNIYCFYSVRFTQKDITLVGLDPSQMLLG